MKTPGKTRPKPASATRLTEFRIDRGNPDDGANPHIDAYFVDRGDYGCDASKSSRQGHCLRS